MKRFAIAAAAALTLAGPLAAAEPQRADFGGRPSNDRGNDRNDRRDNDRNDRRDNDRNDRRDNNRAERWNQRSHNGYYVGNRFYYGQPTYAQMQRRDYRPAYQQWRRGDRLPAYARNYRQVDYRREHLRAPPRGYHYVRDDRGEVLLVGIATGVILSILMNQ
jgi:Ni/Co efflux regulator RcnB